MSVQDIPVPSYSTQVELRERLVTQYWFRARVGDEIVAMMELDAMARDTDDQATQLAKAVRRAGMARAFSAQWLDLDSPELRAAFADLPAEDFARIFDAPVRDEERP